MMPPPMMTIWAWVGSWGAMRVSFRAWVAVRPLCYGDPAGTMAGGIENERSTPCPAENGGSGAVPARRCAARGLSGVCENDAWSPCPAKERATTEDTERTEEEESRWRAARAGLHSALWPPWL